MKFISLDIETTGFEPEKNRIIEFGAIKFDLEGNSETYQSLFNPGIKLPQIITHITGITDKMLSGAPKLEEKFEEIKNFIGDLPIIGHNIQFDTGFLRKFGFELNNPEYDTLDFSSILMPSLPSYSLEILSTHLHLNHKEKHRALDDSIAAMELFLKLTTMFRELDQNLISKIQEIAKRSDWQLKEFLLSLTPLSETKISKEKKDKKKITTTGIDIKKIMQLDHSSLMEIPAPYENLISEIALQADTNIHIAVPADNFISLSRELPEEIGKMDLSENYLSPSRLKSFSERDFFENYEVTALIKFLIWSEKSKSGLLNELNLLGKERNTIYKVNADENFVNPDDEPFVQNALKNKNKKASIISHDYLIKKRPELENLILFDFENFTKRISQISGTYLALNRLINTLNDIANLTDQKELVENLTQKTTILFGLMGILLEKYCEQDSNNQRIIISEELFFTKEWQDIGHALQNLIDLSQSLGEIKNEKTLPLLKSWKELLREIFECVKEPDTKNYFIRIEKNFYGESLIKRTPISISKQIEEILAKIKNYKIIDENIDLCDNGEFFKKMYGINDSLPIEEIGKLNSALEIVLIKDTPEYDNADTRKIIPHILTEFAKNKKGEIAIICSSKAQLLFLTPLLSQNLPNTKIISQLTGSISKTSEKFKEDPENSILMMTPHGWESFTGHEMIDTLFICRLPFDSPETDYMVMNSPGVKDSIKDLMVPKAIISLKKIINRIKKGKIIILDSRIHTKNYGGIILRNLEKMGNINSAKTEEIKL